MSEQSLKPGWKMVKFGEVVKNANLVERDPEANDIERIVGLEHIDPRICMSVAGTPLRMAPRLPANSYRDRRSSVSAGPINARSPTLSLKAFAPGTS